MYHIYLADIQSQTNGTTDTSSTIANKEKMLEEKCLNFSSRNLAGCGCQSLCLSCGALQIPIQKVASLKSESEI
jgi:hypothetical protein